MPEHSVALSPAEEREVHLSSQNNFYFLLLGVIATAERWSGLIQDESPSQMKPSDEPGPELFR